MPYYLDAPCLHKMVWGLARLGIKRCVLARLEIPHEKLDEAAKILVDLAVDQLTCRCILSFIQGLL